MEDYTKTPDFRRAVQAEGGPSVADYLDSGVGVGQILDIVNNENDVSTPDTSAASTYTPSFSSQEQGNLVAGNICFGGMNGSSQLTWQIWLPAGLTGFMGSDGGGIDIATDEVTQINTNGNWYTLNKISWSLPGTSDPPKAIIAYASPNEGGTSTKSWPVDGNHCKVRFATTVPSAAAAAAQYGLTRDLAIVTAASPTVAMQTDTGERYGTGFMGDADIAANSTTGPQSIVTDSPGILGIKNWASTGAATIDLTAGNSPAILASDSNGVAEMITLSKITAGGYLGASDSGSVSIGPQDITTGTVAGAGSWSKAADGAGASGNELILKLSVNSYDSAGGTGWHRMDVTLTFHADGRLASCAGFADGANTLGVAPL